MTARFDRAALALDVRQTTGAYGDIMALMKKVSGYTHRMGELNLDAVPVHGARIDPFYRLPGLRQSLLTAQGHTGAWGRVSNDLFMQLIQGAHMFGPMMTNASGEIGKIISAAESAGRALTAAEMSSIVSKLRALETLLQRDRDKISGLRTTGLDAIRVIAGDYAALSTGSQRIDEAIPAVEEATRDASLPFLRPGGEGIFKMIIEEGAKIRAKLVEVAAAVHGLVNANDAAQHALQGLLTAWATVDGKFKSVITALSESGQAKDAFVELPLLLDVAAESWQQLLTYFQGHLAAAF